MDNKKVCVLFQKDENGIYHFESVSLLDSGELGAYHVVVLNEDKYSSICNQKSTRMIADITGDKESVVLVLSDVLLEKLMKECETKGFKEDSLEVIQKLLAHVVSSAQDITFEKHGGMGAFSIQYKKKEKEMNGVEGGNKTITTGDSTSTIDMSKIDPQEVISKIKKKVIAQDRTVETVVNNIYNNQKMIETGDEDLISSSKSSILLDGPTGTGKTFIVKEVAKELDLPLVIRSSTMYSAAGYKGVDLSDLLVALLEKTSGNLEMAQRGIIVLDEFDKLGGQKTSELEMKKAVQQELLTYLSGAKFPVEYNGQTYEFDTSHITFICLGAFTDLREGKIKEEYDRIKTVRVRMLAYDETEEVATSRVYEQVRDDHSYEEQIKNYREVIQEKGKEESYKNLIREFEEEKKNSNLPITYTMKPEDYIDGGLLREIVGRFSLITATQSLGKEDLIRILKESAVSPLIQLKSLASQVYHKEIVYSEEMIERIAEEALQEDTGARALQTVVNGIRDEVLHDLIYGDSMQIELTEDLIEKSKEHQKRGVAR